MPTQSLVGAVVDRQAVIRSYLENRARSQSLFDLLDDAAYYERPIQLRNPVVFYEGHIPVFSVICFLQRALGHAGIDPALETLFARGIDPKDQRTADRSAVEHWPKRSAVQAYVRDADRAILGALETAPLEGTTTPALHRGQGVFAALEHEVMHQETLLYMWHRFEPERKTRPATLDLRVEGTVPERQMVAVPPGPTTLGANVEDVQFGWDNEFPETPLGVAGFDVESHNITNQDYLEFVEAGGYTRQDLWSRRGWERRVASKRTYPLFWERRGQGWYWRAMFDRVPLPMSWPVYVSHDEARAYVRWKECRLLTEAEFHRAAYGGPNGVECAHPWGDAEPDATRGNFDFQQWDPVPVGSFPAGVSAWGVHDLVGNGWEWTDTPFGGFPGFEAMASYPEYSQDFFDGDHFVVKGASPATGRRLIRRSLRNWFRPQYPYMYATFRCARDAE